MIVKSLSVRRELEAIQHSRDIQAGQPTGLNTVITEKSDLQSELFNTTMDCPVEIDNLIGTTHVPTNGNLIVLPPMQNLPTIDHSTEPLQLTHDIGRSSNTDIML